MHTAAGLVHRINGLVGEISVGDIALGQLHAGIECFGGIIDIVVLLILVFDVVKDNACLLCGGRLDHHFLETAFESTVIFDVLAVFVKSCGSDALDLASRQSRFEKVGGIH